MYHMTYGYLLTEEERVGDTQYCPSDQYLNYCKNSGKIATLLILSEKFPESKLDIEDEEFFEEMANMSYYTEDLRIDDMKKHSTLILKEQSIIAGVSNLEYYFSSVYETILNDDDFIKKLYADDVKFKKFLADFRLKQEFHFLTEDKIDGINLGTYLIEAKLKKINFQDKGDLKKILKINDIDLVRIDETNWNDIVNFINDRHEIVHNPNNQIINSYDKDRIEIILKEMSFIVETVDEKLFTNFENLPRPQSVPKSSP